MPTEAKSKTFSEKAFQVRIPHAMLKHIERLATQEGRSAAQQARFMLCDVLKAKYGIIVPPIEALGQPRGRKRGA